VQEIIRLARATMEELAEEGSTALDLVSDLLFLKNSKRIHKSLLSSTKKLGSRQTHFLELVNRKVGGMYMA
jgi:hypothetical protein